MEFLSFFSFSTLTLSPFFSRTVNFFLFFFFFTPPSPQIPRLYKSTNDKTERHPPHRAHRQNCVREDGSLPRNPRNFLVVP